MSAGVQEYMSALVQECMIAGVVTEFSGDTNSLYILSSFRPESDPAVLLYLVESEADLTAIHNAANVNLACDDEDCDENISGNQ